MIKCKNCDGILEENAEFCAYCGTPVLKEKKVKSDIEKEIVLNSKDNSEMDMNHVLALLFLVGVYIFAFFVFSTGNDILKGNINILTYNFDKLTSFIMLLTLVTVFVPPYVIGSFNEEKSSNTHLNKKRK